MGMDEPLLVSVGMNREKFLSTDGRPLTQSLFLELGYNPEAVYTLKDVDYVYKGVVYPSIKKLFLEASDPTEYTFAVEHFLGWKHWQRISENKAVKVHVDEWREELEVKLRSRAVKLTIANAESGSYQAAKWIADRGWGTRAAGRPTKQDIERETKIQARIDDEYSADVIRLHKG
jgi:hypothetical protein